MCGNVIKTCIVIMVMDTGILIEMHPFRWHKELFPPKVRYEKAGKIVTGGNSFSIRVIRFSSPSPISGLRFQY